MTAEPNTGADREHASEAKGATAGGGHLIDLEKRHNEMWRLTFFLLFIVTAVFAWFSWDTVKSEKFHLEALPVGLVVLVGLFGVYSWKKSQEMAELKGVVRGMDQRNGSP